MDPNPLYGIPAGPWTVEDLSNMHKQGGQTDNQQKPDPSNLDAAVGDAENLKNLYFRAGSFSQWQDCDQGDDTSSFLLFSNEGDLHERNSLYPAVEAQATQTINSNREPESEREAVTEPDEQGPDAQTVGPQRHGDYNMLNLEQVEGKQISEVKQGGIQEAQNVDFKKDLRQSKKQPDVCDQPYENPSGIYETCSLTYVPKAVDLGNRMALYETDLHGPPIVGAAIIRNQDMQTYVDFAHPESLKSCTTPTAELIVNDSNSWADTDLDAVKELECCFHLVPRLSLGAMQDKTLADFSYFTLPTPCGNYLYGISFVAMIEGESRQSSRPHSRTVSPPRSPKTLPMDRKTVRFEDDVSRRRETEGSGPYKNSEDHVMKPTFVAVCVISKVPFFCYIGCKLEYIAQTYFHNKCFSDHQLLLSFVEQMNSKDVVENWAYESLYFNLEYYFKPLALCVTYRALLFIVKSVMNGRKVVLYSDSAARTSTAVLSILTMIPGASSLGFNSKSFGSFWHSWKKFGMPLHLFHSHNVIYPYLTGEMCGFIENVSGYLVGITDRGVIRRLKNKPDMVLDLEVNCIRLFNRRLMEMYYPSIYEMDFFDEFLENVDGSDDEAMVKGMVETGDAIYNSISGYLAKAPSTFINIGGNVKRYLGKSVHSTVSPIKCNESPLRLLDKYFPGSVPNWLKKCAINTPSSLEDKRTRRTKVRSNETPDAQDSNVFTVQNMFNKMAENGHSYHYFGNIEFVRGYTGVANRTREIEYAINHRVGPMQKYLVKFLEDAAYVCGERRIMYHLLMDFGFQFSAMIDCSQPVVGTVIKRGDIYLRGNLQDMSSHPGWLDTLVNMDSDEASPNSQNETNQPILSSRSETVPSRATSPTRETVPIQEKKDKESLFKLPAMINKDSLTELGYNLASKGKSAISNAIGTGKSDGKKGVGSNLKAKADQRAMKEDYTDEIKTGYDVMAIFGIFESYLDYTPKEKVSPVSEGTSEKEGASDTATIAPTSNALTEDSVDTRNEPLIDDNVKENVTNESTDPCTSSTLTESYQQTDVPSNTTDACSVPQQVLNPERASAYVDFEYRRTTDQEVQLEVVGTVATRILELQNNHSIDFIERWLMTKCAKNFFDEHSLNVFNEPVYQVNSNVAKQRYPNGDVYIGELVHLKREGRGTYIAVDGTQYDGEWVDGKRHGEGTLTSSKHEYTYKGEWYKDKREGDGELDTALFHYVGTFKNNQFHGRGKLVHKGGETYEGDFADGKYNGRGKLIMPDGTIKMGSFCDDKLIGVCSVIKTDGTIYVGTLDGELLSGKGKVIYNRVVSFEGNFYQGIRQGQGIMEIKLNEDGSEGIISVEGIWMNDLLNMQEVMVKFPNDYKYVGNMKLCSDLSQIMYFDSYNEMLHSEAEEAMMSFDNRILPHGQGIIKTVSKSTYNGKLSHGMRFGEGDMIFKNGVSFSGQWAFGTVHGRINVVFPNSPEPKQVAFDYGKLIDKLEGQELVYINECLEEVGNPGFEKEFTIRNLEPLPGLLTAAGELLSDCDK